MNINERPQHRAVVTGATSGMGQAIVNRLVDNGYQVVGLDLPSATWGDSNAHFKVDVDIADDSSVHDAFDEANRSLGGIDVVINCAGILGPVTPTSEYSTDDFNKIIKVNLGGAFFVTREAIHYMQGKGFGRIVHVASMAGKEGSAGMCAYAASKGGVISLVKSTAKELATTGITINALAPASIDTPLIQGMTADRREVQRRLIPMGRFGTVEEVAALVRFVVSEEASFTTGFVYDMSGGRAVY